MIYYAVYRGDDLLCLGGKREVCEKLGIREKSLDWLASPAARRREEKAKGDKMVAVRVEVD